MMIQSEYEIGDIVYLITDAEQCPRIITGIMVRPGNTLLYELSCGTEEGSHYEIEITKDKVLVDG